MHRLYLDIETRARVDLKKCGVYKYVEDPEFKILFISYAIDDEPVRWAFRLEDVSGYLGNRDYVHVAHNAQFERVCMSTLMPELRDVTLWDDTMARASAYDLPRGLGDLAKALGTTEKDSAGTRLINMFSRPARNGTWYDGDTHPEEWAEFIDYGVQDVETLREIDRKLPPLPGDERAVWELDQRINDRGLRIDVALATACIEADTRNKGKAALAMFDAGVDNPRSVQQVLAAVHATGTKIPDLKAKTVAEAPLRGDMTPKALGILRARAALANASTAKFPAMLAHTCADGRFRGGFFYGGAHTGRWAGRGVQLQNLPRTSVDDPEAVAESIMRGEDVGSDALKAMIRHCIMGPLTVQDYSAIEARVIAWLAGEQWALDAFAEGRDIYTETAKRMGGLTRQQGKIAVLALGYQGAVGSLRVMGFEGSDGEAQQLVDQWRGANQHIVRFWGHLEHAIRQTLAASARMHVSRLQIHLVDRALHIVLPSGRPLVYHRMQARPDGLRYRDPQRGWIETYGGRLAENITQAVARDILADAMIRLDQAGFKLIGHVHDEVIIEGHIDLRDIAAVMTVPPSWAPDLPLAVGGYVAERYKKD